MAISKVILNGTTLIDTTDKTVTSSTLVSPNTALGADGTTVTGSLIAKTSTDVTVSGATVTVPSGVYSSQVEKSVATGSAGTPIATKGTVLNNSVVVTPSVTNTTGYITGGTKTGTAVTVSASELVSGTKNITSSGTIDVTNYASVSVPAGSVVLPDLYYTESNGLDVTTSVNNSGLVTTEIDLDTNYDAIFETNFYSGYISEYSGNGGIRVIANHTYQLSSQAAQTITPTTTNQTIASQIYLTGTQTILGDVNLISANIASGVTIFGVVGTYTGTTPATMVLPILPDFTSTGSFKATILPVTTSVYLNIPTGYNSVSQFYTISAMPTMTLPTGAITTSTGTLKATINPASTTKYLNIPTGYNSKSQFYTISGITVITLPTSTTTTSTGTLVGTITPLTTVQYLNIPSGNVSANSYYKIDSASGGGSSYNLLYSGTVTANTTSTTATSLSTIAVGTSAYTSTKILYVKIRDTAGARSGRFVGTDNYFFNFYKANNNTTGAKAFVRLIHTKDSDGTFKTTTASSTTGYGIYPYSIDSNGSLKIYVRYNSTNSLTINGTYSVEVYLLDYAPTTGNPYNY